MNTLGAKYRKQRCRCRGEGVFSGACWVKRFRCPESAVGASLRLERASQTWVPEEQLPVGSSQSSVKDKRLGRAPEGQLYPEHIALETRNLKLETDNCISHLPTKIPRPSQEKARTRHPRTRNLRLETGLAKLETGFRSLTGQRAILHRLSDSGGHTMVSDQPEKGEFE